MRQVREKKRGNLKSQKRALESEIARIDQEINKLSQYWIRPRILTSKTSERVNARVRIAQLKVQRRHKKTYLQAVKKDLADVERNLSK